MTADARAILQGRVAAVLNTASGSCDDTSDARLRAVFEAAGVPLASVAAVKSDEVEAALDQAVAAADVLVVLGGDGTIRTAAGKCGATGPPLIPLPGGTLNMLPKALYGERTWDRALADTLAEPYLREISGGLAQGEPFYCAAIMGAPTLWADAREAVRHGRLSEAFRRAAIAVRRGGAHSLSYRLGDGLRGSAEAVAVICPLVSRALAEDAPGLEAAALDPTTASGLFSLAFHAIFDDWRRDPSVERARVRTVRVTGHGRVPVILDGEKVRLGRVVEVTFRPLAFRAITPAPAA
jgi:diacylglycerol kinase family enzyme